MTDAPSTMPPPNIPQERVREVCWQPSDINNGDAKTDGEYFVMADQNGPLVSNNQQPAFNWAVADGAFIYKYDSNAPIQNLRLLPLKYSEAWCTRIPKPTDKAVLRLLDPCATAALMQDSRSATKNLLGQTEGVSYRSPFFCGKQPRMASTTQEIILLRSRNEAYQEAYDYAHKTAIVLTQAAADMQEVINKERGWIKRTITSDPGTVEQIQQRLADQLNSILPPPEYDDDELESIALLGFDAGFDNGQFEVQAKLFAIDAGVMVIEFAAMEVALGPLGGAKLIVSAATKGAKAATVVAGKGSELLTFATTKGGKALAEAMKRLEDIPIFIPGAAGGPGGVVRIGKVINASKKALSKINARALEKALETAGFEKKAGESTHHIVAHSSVVEGAEECRRLFAKFKLDMNAEYNGAFLPWTTKSPNPAGALVHQTLDNKIYYETLAKALGKPKSQTEAINMLKRVRETLLNGTFYHANL